MRLRSLVSSFSLVAIPLGLGCVADAAANRSCQVVQPATSLPRGLEETSGVAVSRAHPGVLWTHNDSGNDPTLFAVNAAGQLVGRVRVRGARATDWEDVALGPCPSGRCVYVADTGDNEARRGEVHLYRMPEPEPGAAEVRAERFRVRYPGGPRDAEALLVLSTGELYLITKGRREPIALYRYPGPLRADQVVTLEHVVDLTPDRQPQELQVTGASLSPSGEWVAVRAYKTLSLYRVGELVAGRATPANVVDLRPLGEVQGEAVAFLSDDRLVLTSEGGFKEAPGTLLILRCPLPG